MRTVSAMLIATTALVVVPGGATSPAGAARDCDLAGERVNQRTYQKAWDCGGGVVIGTCYNDATNQPNGKRAALTTLGSGRTFSGFVGGRWKRGRVVWNRC